MSWLFALLVACVAEDGSFGGNGTEGTPIGGGQAGDSDGDGDGGSGDDTATSGDCSFADLVWSTQAQNESGTTPFYAGDSITFWGEVENPCAVPVSFAVESTCLFDIVTLHPPNGGTSQQAIVPGCSTTAQTVEVEPYNLELQAYNWGPLYVAGQYAYSMQATTPDERALSGNFTIQ
jgi:hypothetical protein